MGLWRSSTLEGCSELEITLLEPLNSIGTPDKVEVHLTDATLAWEPRKAE